MRIRTVKPELFRHEELYDAEEKYQLPLRLVYIGLFGVCDREGRFVWKARTIKSQVLPFDNIDFLRVLDVLETCGFLVSYTIEGVKYGFVPSFKKHQHINNREKESELPEPPETLDKPSVVSCEPRVDDVLTTPTEGKGKEGKGKEGEGKGNTPNPSRGISAKELINSIPDDFPNELKQSAIDWAEDKQSRTQAKTRFQSVRAFEANLKRMAKYPESVLSEAVQCAIASGWQGWEQDNVKKQLDHAPTKKRVSLTGNRGENVSEFKLN